MGKQTRGRVPAKLDPVQLTRRENIFHLYRDMGPTRSYDRLVAVMEDKNDSVSRRTLANWSRQHSWQERVVEYDRELMGGQRGPIEVLDPNFDRVDALLKVAYLALTRVLQSNPIVRSPQDAKALIDAANNALKLVELLRAREPDRQNGDASRERMFEVIEAIEARIRAAGRAQMQIIDGDAIAVPKYGLSPPADGGIEAPPAR